MKKLSFIIASAMLAAVLSGCHGSGERQSFVIPERFDETKNYEISFWAKNDTNLTQVEIYEKAIEDFEAIYPNIKVNLRLYTDYGRIYADVITNIQTDTTPNVCITYPDHIATYMSGANTVVPLDGLMTDKKYGLGGSEVKFDSPKVTEIVPKFLEEGKINGVHYALPFMRSTEACYVNKTFVEKLGFTLPDTLTWDFVWEVSEAAMKKNSDGTFEVNGQNVLIPFIYKSTDNMMIQMLTQLDAEYSTENGEIGIFNDSTREVLDEIAVHAKTREFSTFKISSYPANYLNAGQCIFAVDSTAGATWMGSDAPLIDIAEENLVNFETAVMTVPQYDPDNPEMISQGPSVCVFNKKDSGEVLASWLFTQYLLTNDVQLAYASTEGYVPVSTKAQQSEEYVNYMARIGEDNDLHYRVKLEASRLMLDNVDNTFVTPVFNGSASLRNAAGQLIENVCKAVRRNQDINHDELQSEITSLYKLDQIQKTDGTNTDSQRIYLGPLPVGAKVLIGALGIVWGLILLYVCVGFAKKSKKTR